MPNRLSPYLDLPQEVLLFGSASALVAVVPRQQEALAATVEIPGSTRLPTQLLLRQLTARLLKRVLAAELAVRRQILSAR
jgi:hypothetical protein